MYLMLYYSVWNYLIGYCLHVLQGHIGVVRCIHLMEDRLVSAGDCKRVMVWNSKVKKHAMCRYIAIGIIVCIYMYHTVTYVLIIFVLLLDCCMAQV